MRRNGIYRRCSFTTHLFSINFHLIRLATKVESPFSKIFIIGYVSLLVFHILQNIGMTIQLLPITGIPLPFISYGGSSLWSLMVGIGVVLSIHFHQRQTMPNKEA